MGRSRTSGIVTDAGGNRITTRFIKGCESTPDSDGSPSLLAKTISAKGSRPSKKKRSARALLAELSAKHASGT